MVRIAVHGTATRRVPAERAAVRLTLLGEGDDRATALRICAEAESRLAVALDALTSDETVERWTADGVESNLRRHDDEGEALSVVLYEARIGVRVEFARIDVVGDWLTRIADDLPVSLQHTEWALTDATREAVLRELRAEAVMDGIARAREYAATLGVGEPVVQVLAEPGLRDPAAYSGWVAQSATRQRKSARSRFELRPDLIELTAQVSLDVAAE